MPWTALFYLVGLAATTLHFAAGTWGYFVRTKRTTTKESKRRLAVAAGSLGVLLFAVSAATVIGLATGSPLMVSAPESPPCPAPPLPARSAASAAAAPPAPSASPAASH
jgi:hypothetical protein